MRFEENLKGNLSLNGIFHDKQKQFVNVGHIFHSAGLTFRIEMDCVCAREAHLGSGNQQRSASKPLT